MFTRRLRRFLVLGTAILAVAGFFASTASATTQLSLNTGGGTCFLNNQNGSLSTFSPTITHPGDNFYSTWGYNVTVRRWTVLIDARTKVQIPGTSRYIGQWTVPPYGSGTFGSDSRYIPRTSTPVQIQSINQYIAPSGVVLENDFVTATSYTVYWKNEYLGFTRDLLTFGSCSA